MTETSPTSAPAQTERTVSVSLSNPSASGTPVGVAISQAMHSDFSSALAPALSASDVRIDKVTALQHAIAGGSYKISASDVADKIIRSLLM